MRPSRIAFYALLGLGFCGFAVTAGAATLRPCPLTVQQEGGETPAILAGVLVPDCALLQTRFTAWEKQPGVKTRFLAPDRYGRASIIPSLKRRSLQESLLRDGEALIYDAAAAPAAWRKAEAAAQAGKQGIWAQNDWFVQAADDLKIGEFYFVTGTITRTYAGYDATYLNFGEDWHEDFSVMVPRRVLRSFKGLLENLEGKRVRVRGVTVLENGPMIVLSRPEQMEMLDANAR